jgi:hypothetical protein
METVREATGVPGSGQSNIEADEQEDWGEMAEEDAIKPPTPCPKIPDTGKPRITGYSQNLQACKKRAARCIVFCP